jgi:hypothetical protein
MEAGVILGAVPSLVPAAEGERGGLVVLLEFPALACEVVAFGVEPKKAYQSVKSATNPSAPAAIIFFRSDLGFSSGEAIVSSFKNFLT